MDVGLTPAEGASEPDAALEMLEAARGTRRITVGADRGYDTRGFVRGCRKSRVTPHVAQKQRSAIDRRTTRHGHVPSSGGKAVILGKDVQAAASRMWVAGRA